MKKLLLLVGLFAMALTAGAQNPFAYGLSTEGVSEGKVLGSELTVKYTLNAPAQSVVIKLIPLEVNQVPEEISVDAEGLTAGDHEIAIPVEGLIPNVDYTFSIVATGEAITEPRVVGPVYTFWSPYGICVDNDPESPYFGRILVTEAQVNIPSNSKYWTNAGNGGVGAGIYAFDPQMNRIQNEAGTYGFNGNGICNVANYNYQDLGGYNQGVWTAKSIRISKDGRIFVGNMDVKSANPIYEVNPADLNDWTPIFGGEKTNAENNDFRLFDAEGGFIAGNSATFDVFGAGEDLRIANVSAKIGQAFAYGNYAVTEYPLGTAKTWNTARTDEMTVTAFDGKYYISAQTLGLTYDKDGGLWLSQYRSTPNAAQPAKVYAEKMEEEGEVWWEEDATSKDITTVMRGGGMGFNKDFSLVAMPTNQNVLGIFTADKGALTQVGSMTTTAIRGFNDIAWDYAGNCYSCDNGVEVFVQIQVPDYQEEASPAGGPKKAPVAKAKVTETPAPSAQVFQVASTTGVNDVNAAKTVASVKYYNINGQESATPFEGINVVVTNYTDGSKNVTKVVK